MAWSESSGRPVIAEAGIRSVGQKAPSAAGPCSAPTSMTRISRPIPSSSRIRPTIIRIAGSFTRGPCTSREALITEPAVRKSMIPSPASQVIARIATHRGEPSVRCGAADDDAIAPNVSARAGTRAPPRRRLRQGSSSSRSDAMHAYSSTDHVTRPASSTLNCAASASTYRALYQDAVILRRTSAISNTRTAPCQSVCNSAATRCCQLGFANSFKMFISLLLPVRTHLCAPPLRSPDGFRPARPRATMPHQ